MTLQRLEELEIGAVSEISLRQSAPDRSSQSLTPTVFHEPWWLNAVSDGTYREVELTSGGSRIGRLPYLYRRQCRLPTIGMPMMTHFLGPAVDAGAGKETTRMLRTISITKDLVELLPQAASIWFKLHRETTDTLAFQALGFTSEVQFTTEVAPAPEAQLWAGLRDTTRRVIRRARETLAVAETADPELFLHFYERNLAERRLRNNYDPELCKRTLAEAVRRGAGRMIIATEHGQPKAAVFTVWDGRCEYYLLTTRGLDSGNGGISLLIWEAMMHASNLGLVFDFDGLRPNGDIQFFAGFGGRTKPRFIVRRSSPLFRCVNRFARFLPARKAARGD